VAEKNKKKLSAFEQELVDTAKKVSEYKKAAEANVVSILYKNPEELYNVNLTKDDFSLNEWRVYYEIIYDIVIKEKMNVVDDITVGLYLEKHDNLREKYFEYGGYDTIEDSKAYVNVENLTGYIDELRKWNAILKLCERGFAVKERLSDFADMSAQDIYNEFEGLLNDTFVNIDSDVKSYDISYQIDELIDELDKGLAVGLSYYNMPIVSKETGGMYHGSITLVGGLSNVGKSTFARTAVIPTIIEKKAPIVIMLNEDSIKKWQRELMVFVVNNILGFDLQKHVVRDGEYKRYPGVREKLEEAAQWIKEKTQEHLITIIPFQNFSTDKVIKIIKKYSSMGVKQFLVDTYKLDAGKVSDNSWLQLQQNMVAINDVIKPEANNVHILLTFQLAKGSASQRYYTQENIGVSKNIIDPASTCLMLRNVYDDEKDGEKNALKVYKWEGKNTKIPVPLEKDKHYQIVFIVKNREGSANQYQVVLEHDMSRNVLEEIGFTNVPIDF